MPILDLQRQLVERGRIRLGEKKRSPEGKQYPSKLSKFRITSKDPTVLEDVAHEYGGKVQAWEDQFEVYTTSADLHVAVVPGRCLNQWLEEWGQEHARSHKGPNPVICLRRCDSQTCMTPNPAGKGWVEQSCLCTGQEERSCKPTTRLSVILTKIPTFGVWRLDSKGGNAARELAGSAELLESMTIARGLPVPARLRVEIVTQVTREGTFKFPKPILDIDRTLDDIQALLAGGPAARAGALVGGAVGELPDGGHFTPVPIAELPAAPASSIREQIEAAAQPQPRSRRSNAAEPLRPTGRAPRRASEVSAIADDAQPVGEADEEPGQSAPGSLASDGAGGASFSPSAPEDSDVAKKRAQTVAMWCRDAGLDNDQRHAFLLAFTGQWYGSSSARSSSTQITAGELRDLRDALNDLRSGELRLEADEARLPVLVNAHGRRAHTTSTEPVTASGPPAAGDRTVWAELVAATPGIGEARFLMRARKLANEALGGDAANAITSYDTVPGEISQDLIAWLQEQNR